MTTLSVSNVTDTLVRLVDKFSDATGEREREREREGEREGKTNASDMHIICETFVMSSLSAFLWYNYAVK